MGENKAHISHLPLPSSTPLPLPRGSELVSPGGLTVDWLDINGVRTNEPEGYAQEQSISTEQETVRSWWRECFFGYLLLVNGPMTRPYDQRPDSRDANHQRWQIFVNVLYVPPLATLFVSLPCMACWLLSVPRSVTSHAPSQEPTGVSRSLHPLLSYS